MTKKSVRQNVTIMSRIKAKIPTYIHVSEFRVRETEREREREREREERGEREGERPGLPYKSKYSSHVIQIE